MKNTKNIIIIAAAAVFLIFLAVILVCSSTGNFAGIFILMLVTAALAAFCTVMLPKGNYFGSFDNLYSDELLKEIIAFCDAFYHGKNYAKDYTRLDDVQVQFCSSDGRLDSESMSHVRIGVALSDLSRYKNINYDLSIFWQEYRSDAFYGDLAKFPGINTAFVWDDAASQSPAGENVPYDDLYPWVYILRPLTVPETGKMRPVGSSNYTDSYRKKRYDHLAKLLESRYGDRYSFQSSWLGVRIVPKG